MKRLTCTLAILMLTAAGCSSPDTKMLGKWQSQDFKGFVAEFNKDHTGTTITPVHRPGAKEIETAKKPFKWTITKDGNIKITEEKATYTGKLREDKKLEMEINGAKVTLEKAK